MQNSQESAGRYQMLHDGDQSFVLDTDTGEVKEAYDFQDVTIISNKEQQRRAQFGIQKNNERKMGNFFGSSIPQGRQYLMT